MPYHSRKLVLALLFLGVVPIGCNGGTAKSCASTEDCFHGEICVDGTCGEPHDDHDDAANSANSVADDGGNISRDEGGTTDRDNGDDRSDAQCVIDTFGNTCDDDAFEPNENLMTFAPLLFDNQSWCAGTEPVETQTSDPLTLCAGNELDVFRLMIDNRMPANCLTQQFTWKTEVRISTPCEPELLHIEPFYSNPFTEDRCAEDGDFRCEWSEDGQTFTIEEVRQPEQLMDINLLIEAVDDRDDIQIDYDVVMTITR